MSLQRSLWGAIAVIVAVPSFFAADKPFDVSSIIDKAAAESILGESVKVSTPRNVQGKDGYYSKCNYYTVNPGKSLIIRVYQAAAEFNPYRELEQMMQNSGEMRAISDLGDKARLLSGAGSGLHANTVMLYVVKGNALVTVGLSGMTDDATAEEKVKDAAKKIVAGL